MKIACRTDIGRIRTVNEDSVISRFDDGGFSLAIVADGMGGHQAGDLASRMAVDMIQEKLQIRPGMSVSELKQVVRSAIETANRDIFAFASERESYHGMGTTVVVCVMSDKQVVIGHIGDSRAYKISGGVIEQLTEDHSLVNELVKSGQITREEAGQHPRRNVLTRALGTEATIEVDISELEWSPGDLLLLCSDGLYSMMSRTVLLDAVSGEDSLDDKADRLIRLALEAGGDDNITVVLALNEIGAVHTEGEER